MGGAAFLIKNDIQFNVLDNLKLILDDCDDIWLELLLSNNERLVIGSIYRHPSYNFNEFQNKFISNIEALNNQKKSVVIGGDFNINLLNNNNSNLIQNYIDDFLSQGFFTNC